MKRDSNSVAAQVGRFVGQPTFLSLPTTVAARTGALKPNTIYRIYFISSGTMRWGDINIVAGDSDHPVTQAIPEVHKTDDTNIYCSCKVATGSGGVYFSEIALD